MTEPRTGPIPVPGAMPGPLEPEPVWSMAGRVVVSWILVLTPIVYGIYETLKAVPPLFEN